MASGRCGRPALGEVARHGNPNGLWPQLDDPARLKSTTRPGPRSAFRRNPPSRPGASDHRPPCRAPATPSGHGFQNKRRRISRGSRGEIRLYRAISNGLANCEAMPGAQSQHQRLSPISSAADGRNWSTAGRPPQRQVDFQRDEGRLWPGKKRRFRTPVEGVRSNCHFAASCNQSEGFKVDPVRGRRHSTSSIGPLATLQDLSGSVLAMAQRTHCAHRRCRQSWRNRRATASIGRPCRQRRSCWP